MPHLYQLSINIPTIDADSESDRYMALGAISVTITPMDDPAISTLTLLATPKKWFRTVGLFDTPQLLKTSEWKHTYHEDRDGIELIPGVHVATSSKYNAPQLTPNDVHIFLDPRDAFGDGYHPTTQLCADMLQLTHKNHPITTMLDLGCGTGILSILGKKLGIQYITAIDIESDSIKKTRRNAKKNKVSLHTEIADVLTWESDTPYDLVVANLHTSIIETALPRLLSWMAPHGRLIISGISQQWQNDITRLMKSHQLNPTILEKDGWCGYLI